MGSRDFNRNQKKAGREYPDAAEEIKGVPEKG